MTDSATSIGQANNSYKASPKTRYEDGLSEELIFGCSPNMRAVRKTVEKVAATDVPVLIQGESGTGKEILARLIHRRSPRSLGPFVKVSCAAIPGQLLESELFGYEKGAFTGAYATKLGRIEAADQGTLFLDEIAELDRDLQAKLLHVLQDGYFTRIADYQERQINSRVICVTNRNLGEDILNGKFRQDLFYRISVICIHLPPLRDRRQDIPFLADHLVALLNERYERTAPPLSAEAREALRQDEWHGNIRELENTIARYVLFGIDEMLMSRRGPRRRSAVPVGIKEDETIPLKMVSKDVAQEKEREVILKALEANRWNRRRTAEVLKMSYRSLLYKIQRAGLHTQSETQGWADPAADSMNIAPTGNQ